MSGPPTHYPGGPPRPPAYLTSASSNDSSSAPTTLSPSSPASALPGVAMLGGPSILNRMDGVGSRLSYPPQTIHIPPIGDLQPRYVSDYDAAHQEHLRMRGVVNAPPNLSPIGPPSAGQKRAYRQRRKDPSCDACRERKVKCDATETSSCSECSSRSVKCQFTKETNRRMSSIKQVQDLERQLLDARQHVSQLRAQLHTDQSAVDVHEAPANLRPAKRRRVGNNQDFSVISANLIVYGKDIFRTDFDGTRHVSFESFDTKIDLPSKQTVEHLLTAYRSCFYNTLPFVDVEFYANRLEEIYSHWSAEVEKTDSSAVFLGLLAVGAVHTHEPEGSSVLRNLLSVLSMPTMTCSIDLIRALTLASIASLERNERSLAYRLKGQAIRAAQELGLNHRSDSSNDREEQKCAMWCSLYCMEPMLAVELGLPTIFSDEDYEETVEWAKEQLSDHRYGRLHTALITARVVVSVCKALRMISLTTSVISSIDAQIERCVSFLPPHFRPSSKECLDATGMLPAIYLQDLRLLLHRQQMNPANSAMTRAKGLDDCVKIISHSLDIFVRIRQASVATDNRLADPSEERPGWKQELSSTATTFLCLHVWRCFLFLVAYDQYDAAQLCAKIGAAVGSSRAINEPCGRYAQFFLDWWTDPKRTRKAVLVDDEELLIYLSADMQGSPEQSWAWQEAESSGWDSQNGRPNSAGPGSWDRVVGTLQPFLGIDPPVVRPALSVSRLNLDVSAAPQSSISNRISIADIM